MKTIYLLRHASPIETDAERYDVVPGPGLSEIGNQQAQAAAQYLSEKNIRHIYSSPFSRAMQTAIHVAMEQDIEIEIAPELGEQDFFNNESTEEVRSRVKSFLLATLPALDNNPICFVGHGATLNAMIEMLPKLSGVSDRRFGPYGNYMPRAGIWKIETSSFDNTFRIGRLLWMPPFYNVSENDKCDPPLDLKYSDVVGFEFSKE